jgi:SnoaL-like domain
VSQELSVGERLKIFHQLDFEGFNKQDWELFGSIHTDDVIVEIQGERTEGLEPHVAVCKEMFVTMPHTHIAEHLIAFGDGEWTCAVSRVTDFGKPETKVVTIAKWRGAQISEEYIYYA